MLFCHLSPVTNLYTLMLWLSQALLSCCGHVGDLSAVWKAAKEQMCFDPSCRAAVRPSCVIPLDELGYERAEALTSFGAKISSLVSLIQKIPQNERVLVFVQFGDLLAKVSEALARANVKAAQLVGTPVRRSSIIEAFQVRTPAQLWSRLLAHSRPFRDL